MLLETEKIDFYSDKKCRLSKIHIGISAFKLEYLLFPHDSFLILDYPMDKMNL